MLYFCSRSERNLFALDFSDSSSLPSSLATSLTSLTSLEACLSDPTSVSCTSVYGSSSSLPSVIAATATSVTNLDACLTEPSGATCAAAYGESSNLPALLADKCGTGTCASIQQDVTELGLGSNLECPSTQSIEWNNLPQQPAWLLPLPHLALTVTAGAPTACLPQSTTLTPACPTQR